MIKHFYYSRLTFYFCVLTAALSDCKDLGAQSRTDTLYLSLKDCVTYALQNNLSIKQSALSLQSSNLDVLTAYTALLPNLSVNAGFTRATGRSIDPTSNTFITQSNDALGLSGTGSMTLFSTLRNHLRIQQAKMDQNSSQKQVEVQKNTTILQVTTLYLNALLNQELLQNTQLQLNSTKEQLLRTEKLVDAGSVPPTDLLNLRSQVADNEVALLRAKNTLSLSQLTLKQALLLPYEQAIFPKDQTLTKLLEDIPASLSVELQSVYSTALRTLPEIQSVDLRIRSTALGVRLSRTNLYPTLSLNGRIGSNFSSAANRPRDLLIENVLEDIDIGYLASDPSERVRASIPTRRVLERDQDFTLTEQLNENLSTSVGLNLSVPLFSRWNNRTNIQRAKIAYHRALIDAQLARNTLRSSIEQAYNDAWAALQLYKASAEKVRAVEEVFRSIEQRYALGSVNYIDYQVQSNNLFQARSELLQAKYSFVFRKKILDFYQGVLIY